MEELAIETKGLCRSLGRFSLQNINLELPRGYIMGFIGPNGAGKSTTIKLLMNLLRPDSGQVRILGRDYHHDSNEIKSRVGYVGEEQWFYEESSVAWTGEFVSRYYPNWDERQFAELLGKFGIERSKRIKQLSKGMRVKLALALALAHNPELLIMDEPTSGLDPLVRKEVLQELLAVMQDERRSVFFSSHITEDLEKVADYVTFINGGQVILAGEKDDLEDRYRSVRFAQNSASERVKESLLAFHSDGFSGIGVTDNLSRLMCQFPGVQFDVRKLGLDDILSLLVKGEV